MVDPKTCFFGLTLPAARDVLGKRLCYPFVAIVLAIGCGKTPTTPAESTRNSSASDVPGSIATPDPEPSTAPELLLDPVRRANQFGDRFTAAKLLRERMLRQIVPAESLRSLRSLDVPWQWTQTDSDPVTGPLNRALAAMHSGDPTEMRTLAATRWSSIDHHHIFQTIRLRDAAMRQDWSAFDEVLRDLPEDAPFHSHYWIALALAHQSHGDIDQAIAHALRAMQLDPTSEAVHQLLIATLRSNERADSADRGQQRLARLRRATSAIDDLYHPDAAGRMQAALDLPVILFELGHPDEAMAWMRTLAGEYRTPPTQAFVRQLVSDIRSMDAATATRLRTFGMDPAEWPNPRMPLADQSSLLLGTADETPELSLRDASGPSGLRFQYFNSVPPKGRGLRLFEQFGGGVAVLDIDRDGWPDLHFAQGGKLDADFQGKPPNQPTANRDAWISSRKPVDQMFLNRNGDLVPVPDALAASDPAYSLGVTAGDVNADGFDDLWIGNVGFNSLYLNQGDGSFRVAPPQTLCDEAAFTTSVAVADLNLDGLSDLVAINYVQGPALFDPVPLNERGFVREALGPLNFEPAADVVYLGNRDGSFHRRRISAGMGVDAVDFSADLSDQAASGLGLVIGDLVRRPTTGFSPSTGSSLSTGSWEGVEVFIANDLHPNHLWNFAGEGARNLAAVSGVAVGHGGSVDACMGIASGDLDGDGRWDAFVTNFLMQPANLFAQETAGQFRDVGGRFGIAEPTSRTLGFGCVTLDLDGDARRDVFAVNGHIDDMTDRGKPFAMPPQAFVRRGGVMVQTSLPDSIAPPMVGRGLATVDWNRDGRTDMVATDLFGPAKLWINEFPNDSTTCRIHLVGTDVARDAIGAVVQAGSDSGSAVAFRTAGDGYLCRNEPVLNLPLIEPDSRVTVWWPDGTSDSTILSPGGEVLWIQNHLPFPWSPTENDL